MDENQEQFISWISAKLGAQDEDDLKKKLTELGKEGIKQAYDQFVTESTQAKSARDGGKLDYIKSLKGFQQGGTLALTPQDRSHWNGFVDFVAKKGMSNNPALNQRNTGLSKQLFDEYNKATGKNYNYDNYVTAVQSNINGYKDQMVQRINNGQVAAAVPAGQATTQNYMPQASPTDGWAGTKTVTTKFPGAETVQNGVATPINNNYVGNAVPMDRGVSGDINTRQQMYSYGPRNQPGLTQRQMTQEEWQKVRAQTGWPDVYQQAGRTTDVLTADGKWQQADQILAKLRTPQAPATPVMDTPVQKPAPVATMVAKNEEGGKLEYIKCLQEMKKGGKMGCGCGGMKLNMKKDKGGKLDASFSGKAVNGLDPKKVKMGQGADGVLGGKPLLKRQSGGTLQKQPTQQPNQPQPNKGQAQGNGQAQMPTPEQIQDQKIDMKATELLVKKNQRVDAMTPLDTLMQQLRPKQIKAPKEKTIKIMFDKGKIFGFEDKK